MKKYFSFLVILIFLSGCTPSKSHEYNHDNLLEMYKGAPLEIGVVGSDDLPAVGNVIYDYIQLNEISNYEEFDALIIMPEAFTEADKNDYINFYNTVKYPIFFFGMQNLHMFAFTNENMTMETSKDDDELAYVQGFKNVNGKKEGIQFYKGDYSDEQILVEIFNYVNENL